MKNKAAEKTMNKMTEEMKEDWMWFCLIPGLYHSQRTALLKYFGTPGEVRRAGEEEFRIWKKTGLKWIRNVRAFQDDEEFQKQKKYMEENKIRFIDRTQDGYPQLLKQISDAPFGLFVKGDSSLMGEENGPRVAVVGARACSGYGRAMAEQIGEMLAQYGITLVSGMALGIDGIAQRSAVASGGNSIGVLGCGVDVCYPMDHFNLYQDLIQGGCIVSEFPPGTPGLPGHFPVRNRIISGLSDVTVVVEARVKSGSLITADLALDQGRDVFAVPGRSTDSLSGGCNRLIEQGAGIILSPENLIQNLRVRFPDHFARQDRAEGDGIRNEGSLAGLKKLSGDMRAVYEQLEDDPVPLETLAMRTKMPVQTLLQALLRLQLADLCAEYGKNQYIKL